MSVQLEMMKLPQHYNYAVSTRLDTINPKLAEIFGIRINEVTTTLILEPFFGRCRTALMEATILRHTGQQARSDRQIIADHTTAVMFGEKINDYEVTALIGAEFEALFATSERMFKQTNLIEPPPMLEQMMRPNSD